MTHDIPLLLAAVFYLVAAGLLYKSIRKQTPGWRSVALTLAIAGVLFHSGVQINQWFGDSPVDVRLT